MPLSQALMLTAAVIRAPQLRHIRLIPLRRLALVSIQNSFDVSVTGTDVAGNTFTATTTSDHTVNLTSIDPDALDDSDTTNEDTGIDINVLANDTDLDGGTLSVSGVTQVGNGTVNYTPDANFNGTDSFTYTITDGQGGSDTATVDLTVNGINNVAVVSSDSQSVSEDDDVNMGLPKESPKVLLSLGYP